MLSNILKLEGVRKLDQKAQKTIKGGTNYGGDCLRLCGGSCSFGYCYHHID